MPGASLIALLDDIASVLDDVALLTKVATKKTAGVLGDDLALNAQQVSGVRAERELPIVWAVAKGSAVNKAILVPAALLISALAPWAVTPLLMIGGAFLCFEGFEKVAHKFLHDEAADQAAHQSHVAKLSDPTLDVAALEKDKIRGAIRTDFILSAEIVTIALGTVADSPFVTRISVLTAIATLMTVGVYGLVAAIVKIDDVGAYLSRRAELRPQDTSAQLLGAMGRGVVVAAPFLMKGLSIAGTVAMFLVGGGILMHGIPGAHTWLHHALEGALGGGAALSVATTLADAVFGILVGALVLLIVSLGKRLFRKAETTGK